MVDSVDQNIMENISHIHTPVQKDPEELVL